MTPSEQIDVVAYVDSWAVQVSTITLSWARAGTQFWDNSKNENALPPVVKMHPYSTIVHRFAHPMRLNEVRVRLQEQYGDVSDDVTSGKDVVWNDQSAMSKAIAGPNGVHRAAVGLMGPPLTVEILRHHEGVDVVTFESVFRSKRAMWAIRGVPLYFTPSSFATYRSDELFEQDCSHILRYVAGIK